MSTLKQWSKKDISKIMKNNGYRVERIHGSHIIYKNSNGNHISIPEGECNKMLMRRLIKENNLKLIY